MPFKYSDSAFEKKVTLYPDFIQQLKEDISNTGSTSPYFPTDYELAQYSHLVYAQDLPMHEQTLTEAGQLLTTGASEADGYAGAAYWCARRRQLIIAHRGTYNLKNVQADIQSILRQGFHPIMTTACEFSTEVIKRVQATLTEKLGHAKDDAQGAQYNPPTFSITFTGHSLGGWLAQLTTFYIQDNLGLHPHTVVFDSPGFQKAVEELEGYMNVRDHSLIHQLDITTYVSAPNRVNTCHQHLGTVYRVFPAFPENTERDGVWGKMKDYLGYNGQTHSMKGIAAVFDADTGHAKASQLVTQWPLVSWPAVRNNQGGVSAVAGIVYDYLTGVDTFEYKSLFQYATKANRFHPEGHQLTFKDRFFVRHFAHYATQPTSAEEAHSASSTVLTKPLIQGLKDFQLLRQYVTLNHMPTLKASLEQKHRFIIPLLSEYTLIEGTIEHSQVPIQRFINDIYQVTRLYPEMMDDISHALKDFMPHLMTTLQALEEAQAISANEVEELKIYLRKRTDSTHSTQPSDSVQEIIGEGAQVGEAHFSDIHMKMGMFAHTPSDRTATTATKQYQAIVGKKASVKGAIKISGTVNMTQH